MKKVGILTVQRAVNYGAILQMYGLYQTLEGLGAEPYIVDYHSSIIENRERYMAHLFDKIKGKGFWRGGFSIADAFCSLIPCYLKKHKFHKFLVENFRLTEAADKENMEKAVRNLDVCIAGSDQIWNRLLINDDVYFLDFPATLRKCSYAASFGKEEAFQYEKVKTLQLLKKFSLLSVREDIGVKEIESSTGKRVEIHVDPALLLDRSEWMKLAGKAVDNKEKYILLYWASRDLKRYARKIADKNKWKIYDINDGIVKGRMKNLRALGPSRFLAWLSGAQLVCTTSFHGMVFSILFHIPFKVDFDPKAKGDNVRQSNLLSLLQIRGSNLRDKYQSTDYNWTQIDKIMEGERNKSRSYLENCLGVDEWIKQFT